MAASPRVPSLLTGIDAVVYGVTDLDLATRFFSDWHLTPVRAGPRDARAFATTDGAAVILRPAEAKGLAPGVEPDPTLREVIWGVGNQRALDRLAGRLARSIGLTEGRDGVLRCRDPNGFGLGFRVTQRRRLRAPATAVNAPGAARRIDRAAPVYDHATPLGIGHVVLFAGDLAASQDFYQSELGFQLSDRYPGHGLFLRCRPEGGHHNLFLLNRPGRPGLNHVAFTVRDIHEVFAGGLAMSRKGWETELGPGRHPISSAYFWYVRNPCGGTAEYYADEDYLTASWRPRDFERKPEIFAEWAVVGGIDGQTRRQKIAP